MNEEVTVYDLLGSSFLQRIQDSFAEISEVGSIVFDLSGNPITKPSNFSGYCRLIRSTKKGLENCQKSDAHLAMLPIMDIDRPIAPLCTSGHLADGIAPILLGNRRIAGWGIGQVVINELDEVWIRTYAEDIGVSGDELVKEYRKLKRLSADQFAKIVKYLVTLSKEISENAYKNYLLLKEIKNRRISEERYHSIVENVLVGICEISNKGSIEYANGQMTELAGYSLDVLKGMNINNILGQDIENSSCLHIFTKDNPPTINSEYDYKFDAVVKNKTKNLLIPCHICINPQKDISNNTIRYSVVVIDASAEKLALKKLEEQNRELYQSKIQVDLFFDSNINGLCIIDRALRNVKCNPAYMAFIRNTLQEETFKNGVICKYLAANDYEKVFSSQVQEYELKKEFGLQLYSIRITPIEDSFGNVVQVLITIEDITNYQLKLENNLFSEKLAGVGMLASGIAHDLRNVFAVLGNSQHTIGQLLENYDNSNTRIKMQEILQVQETGLIGGRKILNQLLSFSGVHVQRKDRFMLCDLVDMIIRIYTGKILEKNADIVINIRNTVIIESLEAKFIQIIMNLLSNAIDAITHDGRIEISEYCENSECILVCRDNGVGISENEKRKIFRAFYSSKRTGTGLGLYSVKNIIEEFGGTIQFESDANIGTSFIIKIKDGSQVRTWIQE